MPDRDAATPRDAAPSPTADIVYTHTDEAPALATRSWLPVVERFAATAGVTFQTADISLAARILAAFPEMHTGNDHYNGDALAMLGEYAKTEQANIVKLPNISASIPQLGEAIDELRAAGYDVPPYPSQPSTETEREIAARYARVLGSAVNPVLREGNSDRRVAKAVKTFAQANPHAMGRWDTACPTHVAHMRGDDFYASEQSAIVERSATLRIEHTADDGKVTVLKDSVAVDDGEVVDAAVMRVASLRKFFRDCVSNTDSPLLLSLHLKATMMKVSDPIIFGHAVREYFAPLFQQHGETLEQIGFNPNDGIGDLEKRLADLDDATADAIRQSIDACYQRGPDLAMVDSDRGVTNLHVPSDIIIDASMPAMIRAGGQMWGPDGNLRPTVAMIPDRCYAGVYDAAIEFCKHEGAFDVTTMGTVHNVGLMAKKAEEYGSHDKTFEIPSDGKVVVINNETDEVVFSHGVLAGDIWRMCQTKDVAIRDWVRLAVTRARETGWPTVFWLDGERSHDAKLIEKVQRYWNDHDTDGLDLQIMAAADATRHACRRAADGKNTISVTGNVLRDYLTDLFPILELGTSAKMLSIVPLLAGGGLFETGAGGSAPKHVQQFVSEGHLRWDSLGEFLALVVSLEALAKKRNDPKVAALASALDRATETFLLENRSPSRKVGELDTRGSHFYMALYWAEELAKQDDAPELAERFGPIAASLRQSESTIVDELSRVQGSPVDLGGYYRVADDRVERAMRPSETFNAILEQLNG